MKHQKNREINQESTTPVLNIVISIATLWSATTTDRAQDR